MYAHADRARASLTALAVAVLACPLACLELLLALGACVLAAAADGCDRVVVWLLRPPEEPSVSRHGLPRDEPAVYDLSSLRAGIAGADGGDRTHSADLADTLAASATVPAGAAQIAIALAVFCSTEVPARKVN